RDRNVTGVQTCALPISSARESRGPSPLGSTPPAPWPSRRASRNKSSSSAREQSRRVRAEMKDRRESEETCAREGREKTRSDAFQAAKGQAADHGDGERRRAEHPRREPDEVPNAEGEFRVVPGVLPPIPEPRDRRHRKETCPSPP